MMIRYLSSDIAIMDSISVYGAVTHVESAEIAFFCISPQGADICGYSRLKHVINCSTSIVVIRNRRLPEISIIF